MDFRILPLLITLNTALLACATSPSQELKTSTSRRIPAAEKESISFSMLSSSERFESLVAYNWKFHCGKNREIQALDSEIDTHLREIAKKVIFDGLKKIHDINPTLVETRMLEFAGQPIDFSCKVSFGEGFAYYSKSRWYRRSNLLMVTNPAKEIARGEFYKKFPEKNEFSADPNLLITFYKYVFLHEYLHHLRFDNFIVSKHAKIESWTRFQDVVYACTAQAFESIDAPFYGRDRKLYLNTEDACLTCSTAIARPGVFLTFVDTESERNMSSKERCFRDQWPLRGF